MKVIRPERPAKGLKMENRGDYRLVSGAVVNLSVKPGKGAHSSPGHFSRKRGAGEPLLPTVRGWIPCEHHQPLLHMGYPIKEFVRSDLNLLVTRLQYTKVETVTKKFS